MQNPRSDKNLLVFVSISFLLAFAFQIPFVLYQDKSWLKLTMWVPTIALLMASPKILWAQIKSLSFRKLKYVPLSLLVGWAWAFCYFLSLIIINGFQWNEKFELSSNHQAISKVHGFGMLIGTGEQSFALFAFNLLLSVSSASLLFGLIGGLGEELGWRGYLQPEISKKYGVLKGTIIVGLLWGYWHLPANLAGLNNPTYPIVNAFITFPLFTIALSALFGWLQRKTDSAYFPAFAHGANNCMAAGFLIKPIDSTSDIAADVIASVAVILIAFLIFKRKNKTSLSSIQ